MTLAEFKAWFEGFTEGKDCLDGEGLTRVRQQLEKVSGPAVPRSYTQNGYVGGQQAGIDRNLA